MAVLWVGPYNEISVGDSSFFILTAVSQMAGNQASVVFDGDSPSGSSSDPAAELQAIDQSDLEAVRRELCGGIERLIQSSQRLIRWRSLLLWASMLLLVASGLILIDLLLRREELGLRFLFSTLLWVVVAYTFFRIVRPAWKFSPNAVDVTRWIEKTRPEFEGSLSTAVQLAAMPTAETKYGSQQFREAALRKWQAGNLAPEWESYLQTQPLWRALGILALVGGALLAALVAWPAESTTGIQRLMLPWSVAPWPRDDLLIFHNLPQAVARGSELQLEVVDRKPPLPAEVEVRFREAGRSEAAPEVVDAQIVGDMAVANLPVLERSIEVRAVGGDDDRMDWQTIDVVLPPKLDDSQFIVQPPAYSGMTEFELPGPRVQVLVGSRLRFRGRLNEPVKAMALQLTTSSATEQDQDPDRPPLRLELMKDGQSFVVVGDGKQAERASGQASDFQSWTARESMNWQFRIQTKAGLEILLPEMWAVEVTPDRPPAVVMQEPPLNELTANASLPVVALAQDDLGLVGIRLRAQLKSSPEESPLTANSVDSSIESLNQDASFADSQKGFTQWVWQADSQSAGAQQTKRQRIRQDWRVSEDLAPVAGQRLTVWVEAIDSLGQIGSSQEQDFEIRSPREILDSIRSQEQQVLEKMRDLVDAQRRNMQLATRVEDILTLSEEVEQDSLEGLSSVTQIQDSIRNRLAEGSNSLISQLQVMRELLARNQMDESDSAQQLDQLTERLEALQANVLTEALRQAMQAQQQTTADFQMAPALLRPNSLAAVRKSTELQNQAVREMQSVLSDLMQNEALQQFRAELLGVLENQREVRKRTEQLGLDRLAAAEPTQIERQSLRLKAEQQSLARELEDLAFRMQRTAESDELQPDRTNMLKQALDRLQQDQVGSTMRATAEQISDGEVMQAVRKQQQVVASLRAVMSDLGQQSAADPNGTSRPEQLQQASERISELAKLQSGLAGEMDRAVSESARDQLAAKQDELASATRAIQQEMESLRDQASSRALESAIEAQSEAASAIEQAGDPQLASDAARRAADELERAASSASSRSQRLEEQAQQDRKFELVDSLQQLVDDQTEIVAGLQEEAAALGGEDAMLEDSEREQASARLAAIAGRQRGVEQSLVNVRQSAASMQASQQPMTDREAVTDGQAASFQIFNWTLEQTSLDMIRSAAAAERMRVAPEAIDAAGAALAKLQMAADAMSASAAEDSWEDPQDDISQSTDQQNDTQPNGNLVPPLATLKLLRSLQANINERTKRLNVADVSGPLRNQLLGELTRQQQEIGSQLESWVRRMSESRAAEGNQ